MFYISTNRAYIKVAIADSTRVELNKCFWIILCSLTVNLVHVTDYRVKEADVIVNPTIAPILGEMQRPCFVY